MSGAGICGIGVVGGFGSGVSSLEQALTDRRPEPVPVAIPAREGEITVPCLVADTARLADFMPTRTLRRMNPYIRLGLLAALDAMADAGIMEPDRRGRLGIIVATGHGATGNNYDFQYPFEDREEICGSPTRFSNSVHNAAAAYISIALKELGPTHAITHEDLSFPSALLTAMTWLRQGRVDAVLVGGVDELSHACAYAFHVHGQKQAAHRLPPPGEGACFFVLKAEDAAGPAYATIMDVKVGRSSAGPPFELSPGTCIVGRGGVAATRADYGPWIGETQRVRCYASVYGDLAVDNAFDTAIAAISIQQNTIFADDDAMSTADSRQPLDKRPLSCLKLGVGGTYGWTQLE